MKSKLLKAAFMVIAILGISVTWCLAYPNALPNLLSLLTSDGFFIPPESSIFSFHSTVENRGSGEWWIYAEDNRYYYAMPDHETLRYFAFPKRKAQEVAGFRSNDYTTWPQSDSTVGRIRMK